MRVQIIRYPGPEDWAGVKKRAMVTVRGKSLEGISEPLSRWKTNILNARHSPIRYLMYSFEITEIPSNIATHLCRHVHAQPYVQSLRNDRQSEMDGDKAPRDTPVNMIMDLNAEELMVIANKRLCRMSSAKTREVVEEMCRCAARVTPEIKPFLVPACEYYGYCHEFNSCGKYQKWEPKKEDVSS